MYQRSIAFIRNAHLQGDEVRKVAVWVYVGKAGYGKSYAAREKGGKDHFAITESNMDSNRKTVWFGTYKGQKTLIIDDLNSGWIPYNVLLGLLDGYPLELQTKGGNTWACWNTVIITSNIDPDLWWGVGSTHGYPEENKDALLSRIAGQETRGGVIEFDEPAPSNRSSTKYRRYKISDLRSGRESPPIDL